VAAPAAVPVIVTVAVEVVEMPAGAVEVVVALIGQGEDEVGVAEATWARATLLRRLVAMRRPMPETDPGGDHLHGICKPRGIIDVV